MASSLKTRLVLASAAMVTVVGVGAGVATVLPNLQTDATSTDDVRVAESVAPVAVASPPAAAGGGAVSTVNLAGDVNLDPPPKSLNEASTAWVVPVSAPLTQFPVESNALPARSCLDNNDPKISDCLREKAECTPSQVSWLEEHAYRTVPRMSGDGVFLDYVQFRHAGTGGNALTIKELRPEGEYGRIPGKSFTLSCMAYFSAPIGGAAGSAQTRGTTIDVAGGVPAIFGEPLGLGDDPTVDVPAGAPAVVNLAPGQSAVLGITSTSAVPAYFKGRLAATVSAGSESDALKLAIRGSEQFSVAFPSDPDAVLQLHGGAMCPKPVEMFPGAFKYADITACTVDDFLEAKGLG